MFGIDILSLGWICCYPVFFSSPGATHHAYSILPSPKLRYILTYVGGWKIGLQSKMMMFRVKTVDLLEGNTHLTHMLYMGKQPFFATCHVLSLVSSQAENPTRPTNGWRRSATRPAPAAGISAEGQLWLRIWDLGGTTDFSWFLVMRSSHYHIFYKPSPKITIFIGKPLVNHPKW